MQSNKNCELILSIWSLGFKFSYVKEYFLVCIRNNLSKNNLQEINVFSACTFCLENIFDKYWCLTTQKLVLKLFLHLVSHVGIFLFVRLKVRYWFTFVYSMHRNLYRIYNLNNIQHVLTAPSYSAYFFL